MGNLCVLGVFAVTVVKSRSPKPKPATFRVCDPRMISRNELQRRSLGSFMLLDPFFELAKSFIYRSVIVSALFVLSFLPGMLFFRFLT